MTSKDGYPRVGMLVDCIIDDIPGCICNWPCIVLPQVHTHNDYDTHNDYVRVHKVDHDPSLVQFFSYKYVHRHLLSSDSEKVFGEIVDNL